MKISSYSAPLCVTLSGDDVALYGRPVVMLAVEKRVVVTESEKNTIYDGDTDAIYSAVYEEIFGTPPKEKKYRVEIPLKSSFRALQAPLIVCFVALLLTKKHISRPSIDEIQRIAFSIEKALFGQYSHAQTVCCIQGGLVYYRKEFEFYKTIMKLPMKVPKGFLSQIALNFPEGLKEQSLKFSAKALTESEKYTKRLVFAISQERKADWIESLLQNKNISDMFFSPGNDDFEESQQGLIVE